MVFAKLGGCALGNSGHHVEKRFLQDEAKTRKGGREGGRGLWGGHVPVPVSQTLITAAIL